MALNFAQDNITAFGGDPAKVTIWGQVAVHPFLIYTDIHLCTQTCLLRW